MADTAGVFNDHPQKLAELQDLIRSLEAETSAELVVVALPSLPPGAEAAPSRDFAVRLANEWGVGKAGADNGVLVLLLVHERALEVVTGDGQPLSDEWVEAALRRAARRSGEGASGPHAPAQSAAATPSWVYFPCCDLLEPATCDPQPAAATWLRLCERLASRMDCCSQDSGWQLPCGAATGEEGSLP